MLSTQLALPVTRAGSSLRGTPLPMYRSGASVTLSPPLRSRRRLTVQVRLRHLDCLDDVLVARAAAEVALEALPDLLLARVRLLLEQTDRGQDHARRALPAL